MASVSDQLGSRAAFLESWQPYEKPDVRKTAIGVYLPKIGLQCGGCEPQRMNSICKLRTSRVRTNARASEFVTLFTNGSVDRLEMARNKTEADIGPAVDRDRRGGYCRRCRTSAGKARSRTRKPNCFCNITVTAIHYHKAAARIVGAKVLWTCRRWTRFLASTSTLEGMSSYLLNFELRYPSHHYFQNLTAVHRVMAIPAILYQSLLIQTNAASVLNCSLGDAAAIIASFCSVHTSTHSQLPGTVLSHRQFHFATQTQGTCSLQYHAHSFGP